MVVNSVCIAHSLTHLSKCETKKIIAWCFSNLHVDSWGRMNNAWGDDIAVYIYSIESNMAFELTWK